MSTYEYWYCWCCCTYRVVPYDPSLVVASFVASHSRSCCWAESSNGLAAVSVCLLFLLLCHLFCSCVAFFAFSLAPLLYPRLYLSVCIQLNSTYEDCCCCCTCDHLRGLLLLSVPMTCSIVLLGCCCYCSSSIDESVALCCSFVIAINQLMRLYEHNVHAWSFPAAPVPLLFVLRSFFFSSSDLAQSTYNMYVRGPLPVAVFRYGHLYTSTGAAGAESSNG